jgi:hypothetical protein
MRKKTQSTEELITILRSDYTSLIARLVELQVTLELREKLSIELKDTVRQLNELER